MGDFLDRNLLLWDRDTSNSGRSRWARRAIGAAGSTGRTNVQMVDEVRRIARESSATTSPIPRLGPDPFVDERAICEIRVIANQHGRAALWRNPPAGDAVAARWAGTGLHIDFDPVPRSGNEIHKSPCIPIALIEIRTAALIEIVGQLSRPIQATDGGRSRRLGPDEYPILIGSTANKEHLVCPDHAASELRVRSPP